MTGLIAKYAMKKVMSKEMNKYKSKDVSGPYDPYYEEIPNPKKPGKMKKVRKEIPAYIPTQEANILAKARKTAYHLDYSLFSLFGVRFGWSSVIGLFPAFGDAASTALTLNLVRKMRQVECGLPGSVILMMLFNVMFDFLIGLIPFVGDLADAAVKANGKNVRLLEEHLDKVYKPEDLKARDAKLPRERRQRPASVYVDLDRDDEHDRRDTSRDRRDASLSSSDADSIRRPQEAYSGRRPRDEEMGDARYDNHRSHRDDRPSRNDTRSSRR